LNGGIKRRLAMETWKFAQIQTRHTLKGVRKTRLRPETKHLPRPRRHAHRHAEKEASRALARLFKFDSFQRLQKDHVLREKMKR
jgi:hypothetical protein